jgi:hypothetical protein
VSPENFWKTKRNPRNPEKEFKENWENSRMNIKRFAGKQG